MTGGRAKQVKGRTVHPVRPFTVLWEPLAPAPWAHGCWSSARRHGGLLHSGLLRLPHLRQQQVEQAHPGGQA